MVAQLKLSPRSAAPETKVKGPPWDPNLGGFIGVGSGIKLPVQLPDRARTSLRQYLVLF